jgi:hypothetical protein
MCSNRFPVCLVREFEENREQMESLTKKASETWGIPASSFHPACESLNPNNDCSEYQKRLGFLEKLGNIFRRR